MQEITAFSSVPQDTSAPWKDALRQAVRDPAELLDLLGLPPSRIEAAQSAARRFSLLVPRDYVARMRVGDGVDPLLRQVLPVGEELERVEGYERDPVGDGPATAAPGLLRKYEGRVLLMASRACAVHCRYCFRRHTVRTGPPWEPALQHVAADRSVSEIILSGGDPLLLDDEALARLVEAIASIKHIRRLRIHTRIPIVLPERVTGDLLSLLRSTRLVPVVVVHANHPAELRGRCARALQAVSREGILLLNQSVLLRGVNDDAGTLTELSERLVELGVIPYYLHALDRVEGAAHFDVPDGRGLEIMEEVQKRLPGYAVPRYVREVPGACAKTMVPVTYFRHCHNVGST